jgi:hypothetical protein
MKYTAKIVLFIGLQLVIIGLAFLAGWHNGNPGDREQLEFYKSGIEFDRDYHKMKRIENLGTFQSLVESLQLKGDITNAVTELNRYIDHEIVDSSEWRANGGTVHGLQWPNGEEEFKLLLKIAEYRLAHPVTYTYEYKIFPYRNRPPRILKAVLECRDRRKTDPKWKPSQTNNETLIQ